MAAGSWKCIESYTSKNGKKYSYGDIIYWTEYLNLPSGEDLKWRDNEESIPSIF